jgi:translation elongation factor EF-4
MDMSVSGASDHEPGRLHSYVAADAAHTSWNLVVTPGLVDFSYEGSRAISPVRARCCDDDSKGVEAQRFANLIWLWSSIWKYSVINKIDLRVPISPPASSNQPRTGLDPIRPVLVCAKTGRAWIYCSADSQLILSGGRCRRSCPGD